MTIAISSLVQYVPKVIAACRRLWAGKRADSTLRSPAPLGTAPLRPAPVRMSADEHFDRLASVIVSATGRADDAGTYQASAARKLDLAQYGLTTLMAELSAVMIVPGYQRPASLHVLDRAPALGTRTSSALAA
jgi:hypothetical protein